MIVGGGTAGWMAANLLTRRRWQQYGIQITLIESSDIGIISLGEGSTPYMKNFLQTLGISESIWVVNNSLNATDPSGFIFNKIWREIKPFVGAIVTVVMCIYTACTGAWGTFAGMTGGAVGAAVNGGNILQGMVFGAISGAIGGIGSWQGFIARGAVGGMQSYAAGGKFGHGFMAAGIGGMGGGGQPTITGFVQAAVLGGTATEITGGKFKNGAAGAAFMYAVSVGAQKFSEGGVSQTNNGDAPERTKDQMQMDKLKLEAGLSQLRKDGKLCVDCAIYGSPDDAAKAVLNQTSGPSEQYQLEVSGSIYKQGDKWAYSAPKVGGYGSASLTTDMIGYHTHPYGDLVFSNRDNRYGDTGSGDAGWVAKSQKTLYLGVKTGNRVSIGACDFGKCPEWRPGKLPTQPSRVIQ